MKTHSADAPTIMLRDPIGQVSDKKNPMVTDEDPSQLIAIPLDLFDAISLNMLSDFWTCELSGAWIELLRLDVDTHRMIQARVWEIAEALQEAEIPNAMLVSTAIEEYIEIQPITPSTIVTDIVSILKSELENTAGPVVSDLVIKTIRRQLLTDGKKAVRISLSENTSGVWFLNETIVEGYQGESQKLSSSVPPNRDLRTSRRYGKLITSLLSKP